MTGPLEVEVATPEVLGCSVPILIVDDNAAKRLALKSVLLPLGHTVVEAESGLAALRCVMAQDFAVILLDVCMPDMDGFETAAAIRQRRQSEATPIIFITAYRNDEVVGADRYSGGAADFMFAPVIPDELRAKISVFAGLFRKAEHLAARAEDLESSANRFRLIADASPIGIFEVDRQGRYSYLNPRWTQITGIASSDAVGRRWDEVLGRAADDCDLVWTPDSRFPAQTSCRLPSLGSRSRGADLVVTTTSTPEGRRNGAGWVATLAHYRSVSEPDPPTVSGDPSFDLARPRSVLRSPDGGPMRTGSLRRPTTSRPSGEDLASLSALDV